MRNGIDTRPEVVAGDLCRLVENTSLEPWQVQELSGQLLQRHSLLRLETVVSAEEIVEAFFAASSRVR
jgi:hypothetical protein